MTKTETGYIQALDTILDTISPLGTRTIRLQDGVGSIAAEDVISKADAPSADASLMDGYAFDASCLPGGNDARTVRLAISGKAAAGQDKVGPLPAGAAMRVLTGARIPAGANTVVAEEDVQVAGNEILLPGPVGQGQHILDKGRDIRTGALIIKKGETLTPGLIGYLTTGGCREVRVYQRPRVAIIATGDELLLPGAPLTPGKLYASNMLALNSWCRHFGMAVSLEIAGDNRADIENHLQTAVNAHDVVLTSGGAWTGDRDLTAKCLSGLGWKKCFHRLRLGPGKAAGFGLLHQKPVFILPGGPPSNLVGFLTLALPGLMKLCGFKTPGLPRIPARTARAVQSRHDWTHAEFGQLETTAAGMVFHPILKKGSRLKSIAEAQALLLIPEGVSQIDKKEAVMAYDLRI